MIRKANCAIPLLGSSDRESSKLALASSVLIKPVNVYCWKKVEFNNLLPESTSVFVLNTSERVTSE